MADVDFDDFDGRYDTSCARLGGAQRLHAIWPGR